MEHQALALMEFDSVAHGVLAVDRMLKVSPVALLRCGTIHPGRYLALVGGSVASTMEAHAEGVALGCRHASLVDEVCLADPHPSLARAVMAERRAPEGESVGVVEVSTSPGLLRALDAVLKAVPVDLVEVRLADDLGGRALGVMDGLLPDVQEALLSFERYLGGSAAVVGTSLIPRVDENLRDVLGEGSRFSTCRNWVPTGAEMLED